MDILSILMDHNAEWDRYPPADAAAIEKLIATAGIELPEEYVACLRYSNGGEGELGITPGWFQLWSAEEVVDLNKEYEVEQNAPGLFAFGSSGGGEWFAFDTRGQKPWKVVMLPFIPMDIKEAIVIADDFIAFILAMGYPFLSV